MTSKIGGSVVGGNWKYAHGTAHYGRNFSVKWLKVRDFCTDLFDLGCYMLIGILHVCVTYRQVTGTPVVLESWNAYIFYNL